MGRVVMNERLNTQILQQKWLKRLWKFSENFNFNNLESP